jgi:hypothetical protein
MGMNFLAPGWLAVAAALSAAVVVVHLLARRRPRTWVFPTARFIPDRPTTAASLAARPADLPLLLYRLLMVLLIGIAFAKPITAPPRRTVQLILVDRSRLAPPLDSAGAALVQAADAVIAFDSAAPRASLSSALVAALRAAPRLATRGDSLALTIVAPFTAAEFDQATFSIRSQWKGRIDLVTVPPVQPGSAENRFTLSADDPLAPTLARLEPDGVLPVRLVRGPATSADTAWTRQGGTLVIWPRKLEESGWQRNHADTVGGVASGDHAVVANFFRAFVPPSGETAAVWADGALAATKAPAVAGCIRSVAIQVPEAGDLVLRQSFLELTSSLLAPCSGSSEADLAPFAWLDSLRGPESFFASSAVGARVDQKTPAHRWWLLSAALLFALEPLVRRSRAVS